MIKSVLGFLVGILIFFFFYFYLFGLGFFCFVLGGFVAVDVLVFCNPCRLACRTALVIKGI